jgi:hypothetical protein
MAYFIIFEPKLSLYENNIVRNSNLFIKQNFDRILNIHKCIYESYSEYLKDMYNIFNIQLSKYIDNDDDIKIMLQFNGSIDISKTFDSNEIIKDILYFDDDGNYPILVNNDGKYIGFRNKINSNCSEKIEDLEEMNYILFGFSKIISYDIKFIRKIATL